MVTAGNTGILAVNAATCDCHGSHRQAADTGSPQEEYR